MALCSLGLLSGPGAFAATDPFVTWMRMLHDDWAVPAYAELHQHSQRLVTQLDAVCSADSAPAQLQAAQQSWQAAMLVWRRLEALQMGPTLARRSSKVIDFWPTRPRTIEQAVGITARAPVAGIEADQAMANWGSATKGLPALAWLLHESGSEPAPAMRSAAHCRFTQRVARGLEAEAAALLQGWRIEAQRWRSDTPPDVPRAKHLVLNLMVGSAELMRGKKLEKASRANAAQGRRVRDEAELLGAVTTFNTRVFLLAHFDGLAHLLLGQTPGLAFTEGAPPLGLDDVLKAEGFNPQLGQALHAAVEAARRELAALPVDSKHWVPETVDAAVLAMVYLRSALDPPVAQAWGVRIEFTDADGD